MNQIIREQAFISIVLAEVNGIAQNDASFATEGAYFSDGNTPFNTNEQVKYATFEENYTLADGKSLILPREGEGAILDSGYCSENTLEAVAIHFGNTYAIKGLTINFGEAYPTEFKITTDIDSVGTVYQNDSEEFVTTDTFGDITSLTITPISMVGGQQRLRIKRIIMGIGLSYNNEVVEEAELSEEVSDISEDIPDTQFSATILDVTNRYNVNNVDSFIDYLTAGQIVTVAYGVALDEDASNIEWIQTQTLYLSDWSAKDGKFTFAATNIFAQQNDTYTLGNRIYTRTAYDEAVSIFTDLGLEPDDYNIDNYLKHITLTNPMPEDTHVNCLLLLCNACRCIFFQDGNGVIHIQANFALNLEPEDITLTTVGETDYSTPRNVLTSGAVMTHYADFTSNFASADGSMKILPRNSVDYLTDTGFVSSEVADANGDFTNNPSITMQLEAGYVYYGLELNFSGQPPKEIEVDTSYNGGAVDHLVFTDLENENYLYADFSLFDELTITFTKGEPNTRINVDFVGLGNITDYRLDKDNMTSKLVGTKEELVKDVRVKIFTFQNDENDIPQEVEDDVWYTEVLNSTGVHKEVRNPLISSNAMAKDLAEWLGTHYKNNYSYEVDYRGDPRINAADIIKLEDEYINNLQVSIGKATLKFNGAFSGSLDMRRAMRE